LTLLKEGWLFLKNAYGFLVHPYLTLKRLMVDRSQRAIFASLWLGVWLGVFLLAILAFFIYHFFPRFSLIAQFVTVITFLGGALISLFTLYLLYWLTILWKRR